MASLKQGQDFAGVNPAVGGFLKVAGWLAGKIYRPLQTVSVRSEVPGRFAVSDGEGNRYASSPEQASEFTFAVGGALGKHTLVLLGSGGAPIDTLRFAVDTQTELHDGTGTFSRLFEITKTSLYGIFRGTTIVPAIWAVKWRDQMYKIVATWFQDNYYIFKGMKYFEQDVTGYLDFFAESQSEQGMIFDHVEPIVDYSGWKNRFPAGFVVASPEPVPVNCVVRTPVENMGEYTFIEAIYFAWKAAGDTAWMRQRLENALKALRFSRTSPYYWSERHQLMKRGHTIDFWDYQPTEDAHLANDDIMNVALGRTRHSIMFGDNLRMAASCEYLAEMLAAVGRADEAAAVLAHGQGLRERIEKLAWNGEFFTHQTPEDPEVRRDFGGTDEKRQVVLSNTYALNANISHDKCVAIIQTYQRIRQEMPASSAGEWYLCYPPFERGYGNNPKWDYMNGGVSPIAAGELAHGALQHGFEAYGVDILLRVKALAEKHENVIDDTYKGCMEPRRTPQYHPVDLGPVVNAGFSGKGPADVPGWTGEGENDCAAFPAGAQAFHGVPFAIVEPGGNAGKGCVILGHTPGYPLAAKIAIARKSPYVCILQACSGDLLGGGVITTHYADGTMAYDYLTSEKIGNWWHPQDRRNWKVAWRGANARCIDIGMGIYVMKNEFPDKVIASLEFETIKNGAKWMIAGLTLADADPELFRTDLSYGIPNTWAAGAVAFALIEGLAGIKDAGLAFDKVKIAPRWAVTDEKEVSVTAKYEASGGYVSYRFSNRPDSIKIEFTGNATEAVVELLIPEKKTAISISIDGNPGELKCKTVEQSVYVLAKIKGVGVHSIEVKVRNNQ
jgi:hypothetical protein